MDAYGIAQRGLLVRHLVLPNGNAGTDAVLRFLAEEIAPRTFLNLMDQYRPCYRADEHHVLDRPLAPAEYGEALAAARHRSLRRLDSR